MIDLHAVNTPNGWKISVMLEETELPYRVIPYDLHDGGHQTPQFRKLNPNNKLPVIVDHKPAGQPHPVTIFESGAILIYLAEKAGKFLPTDFLRRTQALQWLMWQMAGLGPMLGQKAHFMRYAPQPQPYALERYTREVLRLINVMEYRLTDAEYLAEEYSIADIACFPLLNAIEYVEVDLEPFPNIRRWREAIRGRPRAMKGILLEVPEGRKAEDPEWTEENWSRMFGDKMLEQALATNR